MSTAFDFSKAIIETLPSPLLLISGEDRVLFANSAAEDFFQIGFTSLLKLYTTDLFPNYSPALQAIAQVRNYGGVVNEYASTAGTPRFGGERMVDVQFSQVSDHPTCVLITIQRQSIAHKFDQQLARQGAAKSVSGMAAMLAHEIKNPLAGIRGAAQLIEPGLNEDDRGLARLICDETERIRKLVDQMEVFSDQRPLQRESFNIHAVLDRVKQLTLASAPTQLRIIENYDPSLPTVSGSLDQMVQVFLNLAKNAVEAIDTQSGEVTFTTAFRPGVKLSLSGTSERVSLPLEVCVHDDGPGVPDNMRDHIFDPFISTKAQGRGLGLALVAKIIRDHGGIIECVARAKGTTFRVLLPLELLDLKEKS